MAVICTKVIKRHIRSILRTPIIYEYEKACITTLRKSLNIFDLHRFNSKTFSSSVINKYIAISNQERNMGPLSPLDPSSFSRPEIAIIRHISLILDVDFENKVLSGIADLNFDILQNTNEIILDVNNLTIQSIEFRDGTQLHYSIDSYVPNFGSKLSVTLPNVFAIGQNAERDSDTEKSSTNDHKQEFEIRLSYDMYKSSQQTEKGEFCICGKGICKCCKCKKPFADSAKNGLVLRIRYKTSPSASALQWLEPNQTSGKKHPYLFSQCQPIHARSILPCQDTPAVKFTYDAEVTAPEEFVVLMSAVRGENRDKITMFHQSVPIPSYLLAIAVAVLEHRRLGPRSLVWSEREEIERSAWEFADTERYLEAAENLCGPYQWGQYDLLVLPPSFPYGGMENPCLTFVTPTLLAGDRSQADVIVHEIMHSWTGNLVTNRNFEHFWLNEGFTVFLERKVGASLIPDAAEAKRSRDFHSILGLQELSETINDNLGSTSPLTRLVPDLNNVHPDDAFSRVPYEKGSLFLRYLEDLVGGPEVFDEFLRSYLGNFQKMSLDSDEFKEYLLAYFGDQNLTSVNWDAWFYGVGMPPVIPDYDTSMTKAISALVTKITEVDTFSYEDVKSFTPHQMINLLQDLIDKEALPLEKLRSIGEIYKLNSSNNSEIVYRWLRLCIRSRDLTRLDDVFSFVNRQGRMKYVRPIYRDLYAWEEVRQQAIDNFLEQEPYMMHVSAYTLRKDLHLSE